MSIVLCPFFKLKTQAENEYLFPGRYLNNEFYIEGVIYQRVR